LSADAVIGIGGGWGTLTEIGLALKHQRPVLLLDSWMLELPEECRDSPLFRADSPEDAVQQAIKPRDSRE
jgi:predicted Rossmann-fold nucleotide-binding protein